MKLSETLLVSASVGCFILWVMEIRRTGNFTDSYWLIMLCLTFLLLFQYVRTRRLERSGQGPVVPMKDPKPQTDKKSSSRRRSKR